jgi:hypothetical protein
MSDNEQKPKRGPKSKDQKLVDELKTQGAEQRLYNTQKTIHHDLYKLNVAQFQKNLNSMPGDVPDYRGVEHCHFFHTVDSNGRAQANCSSIAGHFHVMKITSNPAGGPPLAECISGPMKMARVRDKKTGKWVKKPIPFTDPEIDSHRHEVVYLKSDDIYLRTHNIEAAKVQSVEAQKAAPVAGAAGVAR